MAGGESKQTKVWMKKQTIDSKYLAERQQSVSTTLKFWWHLKSAWLSVCVCVCVCPLPCCKETQGELYVTGESWSHFDEDELAMLWLAGLTVAESGGFSHSVQMSLFNQPLLNHMRGEKNPTDTNTCTLSKNQELFSEQRWRVMIWKFSCWCGSTAHKNVLIPLTCQGVLGLKERTEASFHIGKTTLILLGGLLLQITGCNLQLFKTEGTRAKWSCHYIGSATCDDFQWFYYLSCLITNCLVWKMSQILKNGHCNSQRWHLQIVGKIQRIMQNKEKQQTVLFKKEANPFFCIFLENNNWFVKIVVDTFCDFSTTKHLDYFAFFFCRDTRALLHCSHTSM